MNRLFAGCAKTASEDEIFSYAKTWHDLDEGELNEAIDVAINEAVSGFVPSSGAVRQIAIDSRVADRNPNYCELCNGTGFIIEKYKVDNLPYKEASRAVPCKCMPVVQRDKFREWHSKFKFKHSYI